jgi:hypothetical protein
MSKFQLVEIDGEQCREYDLEYIKANPIPAKCTKCKLLFTDGQTVKVRGKNVVCNDAIRSPSLTNCRCWQCHGPLVPLEKGGPNTVEEVEQLNSLKKLQPQLPIY